MIVLLDIMLFLFGSWSVIVLFRRLRRQCMGFAWWFAFVGLIIGGAALGSWCAFSCEYPLGTHFRIGGFPFPIVFFHLEDGIWVDFPVPEFQVWLTIFTNIITVSVVATLPLWLAFWPMRKGERRLS